jgi:hypothetical protein
MVGRKVKRGRLKMGTRRALSDDAGRMFARLYESIPVLPVDLIYCNGAGGFRNRRQDLAAAHCASKRGP